mmetsp:Transcript_19728/g.78561  ORF Transcript_19728/g.78561 Transcript_19728/m.78561 type:complete len:86 (+) Transcript_19728:535-792(+)
MVTHVCLPQDRAQRQKVATEQRKIEEQVARDKKQDALLAAQSARLAAVEQALRENREVLEKLASIQNVTLSSHIDAALAAESPPK